MIHVSTVSSSVQGWHSAYRNEEDEGDGKGEQRAVPSQLDRIVFTGEDAQSDGNQADNEVPPRWCSAVLRLGPLANRCA